MPLPLLITGTLLFFYMIHFLLLVTSKLYLLHIRLIFKLLGSMCLKTKHKNFILHINYYVLKYIVLIISSIFFYLLLYCRQISIDCTFLESQQIIDYSLLLGLHFRAPEHLKAILEPPSTISSPESVLAYDGISFFL